MGNNETQGLVPVSKIEANTDCTDLIIPFRDSIS